MINDKFKQKMAALEKERDEFIARLTPEEQRAFKQKQSELNQQEDISAIRSTITWGSSKGAKSK